MTADANGPEVLASFEDEMEAASLMQALAEHGIRARTVGGYTAGFRAEAPGRVQVVVNADDLSAARNVLAQVSGKPPTIDWSTVDCGDTSPVSSEETGGDGPGDSEPGNDVDCREKRPFQFSIAQLLLLQLAVSIVLSIWKGVPGAAAAMILIVGSLSTLIVTGTVRIGSNLQRGRREVAYLMRVLGVGVLVFLATAAVLSAIP